MCIRRISDIHVNDIYVESAERQTITIVDTQAHGEVTNVKKIK